MDQKTASEIVEAAISLAEGIGKLDHAIANISDYKEKIELVQPIGNILRIVRQDILQRVFSEYPDLNKWGI